MIADKNTAIQNYIAGLNEIRAKKALAICIEQLEMLEMLSIRDEDGFDVVITANGESLI